MAFVIDTGRLDVIRYDIGYSCIPQITSAYNTVVSIRTNLPSKVLGKKWINSNLRGLYRDIDNINDDLVKIQNLLYKAVEKMNEAERRSLYWNSLKSDVVSKGRAVVDDIKDFGSDLYNDYEAAKDWFGDKLDKVYETGAEVFEKVSNWVEDLTWEDVKDFFKTTGATIVVALESLTKGLLTLLQAIVDLVYIAVAIVGTVFTGISDGVNYILTGESGGYTKALWDDTMALVAEVGTLTNDCCNWITDNNPDWINEYSLIEAGGVVDEIIQGIGYMVGIIGISVATFGAATPVALAVTAGTLGFAKSTAEHWEEGKDAASGLLLGAIDGGWEALQYYVGGKIGTSVFGKITSKIANPILQKLAVSGLRITADSLTGAVEVPFQSAVAMIETRVDDIDGNELSWDEAWNASGGWIGVIQQTAIAGLGSLGGEVIDFGKAGIRSKKNGSSFGDALNDIYIDDINTAKLNSEKPFGRFSKKGAVPEVDISDNIENQVKNNFPNDSIDDGAIAMANYRTGKGMTQQFRFSDPSNLPDLDSSFWKNIDNPDKIIINVNGRQMSFDDAISYKANYDLNMKDVFVESQNNIIFDKDDISALLAKAEITDYHTQWGKRKLSSWAHSNFDGVFGSDQIDELFSRVYKVDDQYWGTLLKERGLPDNILGFVDRNSQLYLPQRANEHSAYHELFHQLSEINGRNSGMKIQTADGQLVKVTGIREYFSDGFNSTLANESLTDFLASKYGDGLLYESMYSIENVKYWNRIDDAITKIYGSENSDILLNAYLSNDTSAIRNFFDMYSTKGTYDDFIRKMVPYKSDAVEEIISSIEKNVYRKQSSLSSIIKSIFGRK